MKYFLQAQATPQQARHLVRDNWKIWRLVTSDEFSYTEVKQMDFSEIEKANAALEYKNELIKKARNKKK